MNTYLRMLKNSGRWPLALAAVLAAGEFATVAAGVTRQSEQATITYAAESDGAGGGGGGKVSGGGGGQVSGGGSGGRVSGGETAGSGDKAPKAQKDAPWLGVGVEEASEALAAQLGLAPGGGLVVTYVAPESPAAKAGLQKNDVLAELENQLLVHPVQLRKLVRARKEGDPVNLVYYRAAKKETVSVTLGKTPAGFALLEDQPGWIGSSTGFTPFRRYGLEGGDDWGGALKGLRDASGRLRIDQQQLQHEVRRSMDEAGKAYAEVFRLSTNAHRALGPSRQALDDMRGSRITRDRNATVTVRSTGEGVKSIVKADDSGTIVIVSNPKPRLTAHDNEGKLLFDGEIDTPEQREKVPRDLWEKAEPLLDKVAPQAEDEPGTGAKSKIAPPHPPHLPAVPKAPTPPRAPAPPPAHKVPTV